MQSDHITSSTKVETLSNLRSTKSSVYCLSKFDIKGHAESTHLLLVIEHLVSLAFLIAYLWASLNFLLLQTLALERYSLDIMLTNIDKW